MVTTRRPLCAFRTILFVTRRPSIKPTNKQAKITKAFDDLVKFAKTHESLFTPNVETGTTGDEQDVLEER